LHDSQLVLQAEQGAEHVGVKHRGIALGGLLGHRPRLAFRAGIVDCGIEAAKPRDRPVYERAHILLAADIGADEVRLDPQAAQLAHQGLALVIMAPGDDDSTAGLGESEGRGAADAGQRASDQNDL
jgi:hypothetical protein